MPDEPLFPEVEAPVEAPSEPEPPVEAPSEPAVEEGAVVEAPPVEVSLSETFEAPEGGVGDGVFVDVPGLYDADGEPVVPLDERGRLEITSGAVSVPATVAENLAGIPSVSVAGDTPDEQPLDDTPEGAE